MRRILFNMACSMAVALFLQPGVMLAQEQVAAPSWEKLAAAYKYEAKPANAKEEAKEDATHFVQRVVITSPKGETLPALFRRPKAEGVYACVLLLHGLGSKKEDMSSQFGRALADKGIASFALDAPEHGERKPAQQPQAQSPMRFLQIMRGGVVEYRAALDYLKTRKDVDSSRIGLLGYSMGAMMGAILSGVDDRVKATVLCVGGDVVRSFSDRIPPAFREHAETVAPSNFVGHISPRAVLMINGKQDQLINEAAAKALHDAAKEPKEIIWADAGHILPPAIAGKGVDWLVARLAKSGSFATSTL